jgi:tetratricopeptide (TPR) repeat protein
MKKIPALVLFMVVVVPWVFAQYNSAPQYQTPQPYGSNTLPNNTGISVEVRSLYFDVVSDGGSYDAEILLRELELRFEVYNRLFRFNAAAIPAPLKVRSISNKFDYDRYVMERLGSVRDGAVYLHYQQPDRRELIINRGSAEESRMLPHQAFIQYLRAFVSQPPTWMREGFAIYFNTLKFDKAARELRYEENLSWLETVKNLGTNGPSLETVFLADLRGQPEYFQPVSWALVSFFLNAGGNNEYFRTLTESFMLLSDQRSAAENAQSVLDRLLRWTNLDLMTTDYYNYINSRRTFAELVDAGQRAYGAKDYINAASYFQGAIYQKPTHYAPYYYLGLISYENRDFDNAEVYYRTALNYGADVALLNYALGVNAATANRVADAINYLETAIAADPIRYREKAEAIIARLR